MEQIPFYVNKKIYYIFVERKQIKNMYFRIKNNEMHVTANKRIKQNDIKEFVSKHIDKFVDYLEKSKNNELFSTKNEFFYIFGSKKEYKVLTGFSHNIVKKIGNKFYIQTKNGTIAEQEKSVKDYLQKELSNYLEKTFLKFEKKMELSGHTVKTTYKVSNWGSNVVNKKLISFSTRLAHYRKQVIDYVIVHELAHSYEPNHSDKFWSIVKNYCSNFKELRQELKSDKTIQEG